MVKDDILFKTIINYNIKLHYDKKLHVWTLSIKEKKLFSGTYENIKIWISGFICGIKGVQNGNLQDTIQQ